MPGHREPKAGADEHAVPPSRLGPALPPGLVRWVSVEVLMESGRAAEVSFRVDYGTVTVWDRAGCRAVFDRGALHRWLTDPGEKLNADAGDVSFVRDCARKVALRFPALGGATALRPLILHDLRALTGPVSADPVGNRLVRVPSLMLAHQEIAAGKVHFRVAPGGGRERTAQVAAVGFRYLDVLWDERLIARMDRSTFSGWLMGAMEHEAPSPWSADGSFTIERVRWLWAASDLRLLVDGTEHIVQAQALGALRLLAVH